MRVENLAATSVANSASSAPNSAPAVAADRPEPKVESVKENQELKLNNEKLRLEEAIAQANKAIEGSNRHFKYEVHEPTKAVIISVIDNETNEVVREIPARKLLDVVTKLMELAGLVFDERR